MASVPLQRCINKAKKEGYELAIVERFIPFPRPFGHRVDMFGLFDAVAVKADVPGVLGIQACRDGDVAAHFDKTQLEYQAKMLAIWKAAGNKAVIWGWGKKGPRGERKVWTCREIQL